MNRKPTILVLLLCFVLLPQFSFAQTMDAAGKLPATTSLKDYQRVLMLLSSIHGLPSKAAFEETPKVESVLFGIASGDDRLERSRAVVALGRYWPSAESFQLISNIVAGDQSPVGLRIRSVMVLSESFRELAVPVLEPLTTHANRQVQRAAIVAIAKGDTAEGRELLFDVHKRTDDVTVRKMIESSLPAIRFQSAYQQAGD